MKILRFLGVLVGIFYFGVEHASAAITITLSSPNARVDDYTENGQTVPGPFNGTTQIYVDRNQSAGQQIYFYGENSTQIFLPNDEDKPSAIKIPERFFVVNYVANCPSNSNIIVEPGFVKWGFEGYFDSENGGTQMFTRSGFLTADGESSAISYNSNTTWHAQWSLDEYIPVQFPNVSCAGYDFVGWFDSNNNQVTYNSHCTMGSDACTGYIPQGDITLYGQWEKSASATEDYSIYVACSEKNAEITLFDRLYADEQLDMQAARTYVNDLCKSPCGKNQMNFNVYVNGDGNTLVGPTNDSPVSSITGGADYMIGQTSYNAPTSITLVPFCELNNVNYVVTLDNGGATTAGSQYVYVSGGNVYTDAEAQHAMTPPDNNKITVPQKCYTITFVDDSNSSTIATKEVCATFLGYFASTDANATLYIAENGYLKDDGISHAASMSGNETWYASK